MSKKPAPETVFQRALRTIDCGPDDIVEFIELYRPGTLRSMAIGCLNDLGVTPIGHSSLVEFAIASVAPSCEQALREWHASLDQRRQGRRRNSLLHNLIQTAALQLFWTGSHAVAAKDAAAFLGYPATKSTVEKAESHYLRDMGAVTRWSVSHGHDPADFKETTIDLVVEVKRILKEIAATLDSERDAAAASRKAARHAGYFGAVASEKIGPSSIGGDQ